MKFSKIFFCHLLATYLGIHFGFPQNTPIVTTILSDETSFYYTDFKKYPALQPNMPIGVFDSGTGGLTVLNAIVTLDSYNNTSHQKGGDGIPDFAAEDFIYLADQANMPYGNYAAMNKTDLLKEHIIKDAQFLLGNKYYNNNELFTNKKQIKVLVVACNTATAYGLTDMEQFLDKTQTKVKVIGVINAGVKGALATFKKSESGSIGVFATAGTVASNGYTNALKKLIESEKYQGKIQFFTQGGVGLAEAVDEDLNYIDKKATQPRDLYKGPSLEQNNLSINKTLLKIYGFDFSDFKMLCDAKHTDQCTIMQINSPENYVRYHLVSLLEKMKATPDALPLKTLILGCTHYPFLTNEIQKVLVELRKVKVDGKYRYRKLLSKNVQLIDPSVFTAQEVYNYLRREKLLSELDKKMQADFYISIPNLRNIQVVTEDNGKRFTYDYKYGRNAGSNQEFIQTVPFSKANIPLETSLRLEKQIPKIYELLLFSNQNQLLSPADKW
ncbi:glutamate racemase [Flavobacterium nackdongense]|uniref:Asp/Glu/hydantoin racemase n=1 Tax=Flavobacterium nackdongense TaxID=2547394 RepID=A0A4P6YFT0_9FLAO|nr:aspartate/glutamate racemase family protein [Flavobacterium nackdongense]QBN19635.1 Asp/Glu/hydantoin racemase [Flavobacterium nackdongense]